MKTSGKKRGRKAEDPKNYIIESMKKIKAWTKELNESKGKKKSKEREMLRNRISALENRVEKKKAQMHFSDFSTQFKQSFDKMAEILIDEVTCSCRDNIIRSCTASTTKV